MSSNDTRADRVPLKFCMFVMWTTMAVYLLGPIRWISQWDRYEVMTVALLCCYFTAFAGGYVCSEANRKKEVAPRENRLSSEGWKKTFRITILINLILTAAGAMLYSETTSISALMQKALQGLLNPATNYYDKNASSRMGSVVVWLTFFYSPMMYITNMCAVLRFKKLPRVYQACVAMTFVIEVGRWLAVGTNKGLFDVVLIFVTYYLIIRMLYFGRREQRTRKNRKKIRRIMVLVLIGILLFLTFFGTAMADRVGGAYHRENFESFPYVLVPEGLRVFVEKVDSYLVQGYHNMASILRNCEFHWTFGAGNSRFFMQIVHRLTGIDLTGRTYPYQLEPFGVDPLASWHSAYAWFASDVTFVGVIVLMFILGYFMCSLVTDIIRKQDPVAIALFYLTILMVVNASCTNYVLAYTNGFFGFWALAAVRVLQKVHVRFTANGKTLMRFR